MDASLPRHNMQLLNGCRTFIVEEVRSARRFLKSAGFPHPIDSLTFHILNEHTAPEQITHFLDDIEQGYDVGLLSEAGLPCIADPGALVTRMAQQRGFEVVPLVGPSSLMLALMASGLNGQQFAFHGYLPVKPQQRAATIRLLEANALKYNQTQIFIEAPYRNDQMLQTLATTCRADTLICVASDLTLASQYIRTLPAKAWQQQLHTVSLHKRNTVFLIGQ
ncbi:MAG: SAM-dependent methyltransferase [Bacteroidales bacterium]|nr:SAM-dependent methyltransferase [Bacteroidales bacterium]